MSPRTLRAQSHRRCACLLVGAGTRCTHRAVARVTWRLAGDERTRRNDACGIHDHLSMFELIERGAVVEAKPYVRWRRRRAKASA